LRARSRPSKCFRGAPISVAPSGTGRPTRLSGWLVGRCGFLTHRLESGPDLYGGIDGGIEIGAMLFGKEQAHYYRGVQPTHLKPVLTINDADLRLRFAHDSRALTFGAIGVACLAGFAAPPPSKPDWSKCRRNLIRNNVNSRSRPDTTSYLLFITPHNDLSIARIFLGRSLSKSQKIYVFRYEGTALYALTADSTGQNLPWQACPAGWQFEQSITLWLDKSSPKHELIKATLAAIGKHGFYLTHAALQTLPVATARDRAWTPERSTAAPRETT
jgi:hypothetical protein